MPSNGVAAEEITLLLKAWSGGNEAAFDKLAPVVYSELKRMARRYMALERAGSTLQSTALVHEAYLRLVDMKQAGWQDRAHFFAVSAQMMRRILVDAARARAAFKRGGAVARINLDEAPDVGLARSAELVMLDDALSTLAAIDPRRAKMVELRFFGGLDVNETAEVLRVSPQTVVRDWKLARAWLRRELQRVS